MCMDYSKIITHEPGNNDGRIPLAVERYKKGEISLSRAAEVAGLPVGQMMTVLQEFGVRSRIDLEDYRQGLANLAKVW
jgi:predicted HTH domain antitoxin